MGRATFVPPSSMTLRARKPAGPGTSSSSPDRKKAYHQSHPVGDAAAAAATTADAPSSLSLSSSSRESAPEIAPAAVAKKLPRVILKVGPRPET